MPKSTLLALLAVTAAQVGAAEGESYTKSVRVGLTALPQSGEIELTATGPGGTSSASESDDWDSSGRLSVGVYLAQPKDLGFYVGLGVALSGQTYDQDGTKIEQGQFGFFVEPGVVFHAHQNFSFEVGIPIGLGVSSFTDEEAGDKLEADGAYAELGIVARPVLHLGRGLLYLEVGALANSAAYEDATSGDYPGVTWDIDVKTSGTFFAVGGGIAF
jgi:hypothetical protein